MKIFFLLLLLIFPSICFNQKTVRSVPVEDLPPVRLPKEKPSKYKPPKMSVKERIESYFLGTELKPWHIVNNLDPFNERSDITVGGHRIKWTSPDNEETKIDIDGDVFSLEGKVSLNNLEEGEASEQDKVNFAGTWEQIRLYDINGRQVIGVSMGSHPCTGIGCGVAFFLIYDLKTKNKSFFGSYRIDREVKLYDFGNDGTIDFLSGTYSGESDGVAKHVENIHELFTMDERGTFRPQTDKNGKKYFFKRTFKAKTYKELDKKFVHNWVEEIK